MGRQHLPLYAIALAVIVVGLAFAGVPVQTVLLAALVLVCPVMMLVMMGGRGHQDVDHTGEPRRDRTAGSTTPREPGAPR